MYDYIKKEKKEIYVECWYHVHKFCKEKQEYVFLFQISTQCYAIYIFFRENKIIYPNL